MEVLIDNYNNFIDQLKIIFKDDNTIMILNKNFSLSNNEKINKCKFFNNKINEIDFHSFYANKIKIFSHKDENTKELSESLFGNELCIKNLLNNQPDEVKNIIWKYLHTIWLYSENLNNIPNKEYIILVKNKLNPTQLESILSNKKIEFVKSDAKKKLQELLDVDLNEETTDMIDEIINSFEVLFNDTSGNFMANIIKISQTISNKYSGKIKNGNIEIDKIMEAILGKIPGMENIFGKLKSMNTLFQKPQKKETVIIDENFSTANVKIGELPNDTKSSMNIGSILKMADKIGIIPDLPGTTKQNNNVSNSDFLSGGLLGGGLGGGLDDGLDGNSANSFNLNKMMNIMSRLHTQDNNNNEMENIHNEMDNFLKNELGLDINKINEKINNVIKIDLDDDENIQSNNNNITEIND